MNWHPLFFFFNLTLFQFAFFSLMFLEFYIFCSLLLLLAHHFLSFDMAFKAWYFLLCVSLLASTTVMCNEELEEKVVYPVMSSPVPPLQPPPAAFPPGLPSPSPPTAVKPYPPPASPLPPPAPPGQPLPPPAVKPLPPPAPPVIKPPPIFPPVLPPVKSFKDCIPLCGTRCKLHSRKSFCMRACMTCCGRCKCVPPGTYGNRELCGECYTDMTTHGKRLKCP